MSKNGKIQIADGIYPNQPFEEYVAIDRLNFSSSKMLEDKTPAHYLWSRTHPKEPTKAMIEGRRIHELLFEKEIFYNKHAVMPEKIDENWKHFHIFSDKEIEKVKDNPYLHNDQRTTIYKQVNGFTVAENPGKEILTFSEWDTYHKVVESCYSIPRVRSILENARGMSEVTICWTDPITGAKCKGRLDRLVGDFYLDLKTTVSANTKYFSYMIRKQKYHAQAAFYMRGLEILRQLGFDVPEMNYVILLAVEKTPPFVVVPFYMNVGSPEIREGKEIMQK